MRLCVIGSGSSGNVLYAEAGDARVLVDVGLSAKETVRRLTDVGVEPSSLSAIVLTHEHADHAKGVSVFARTFGLPVYTSPSTRAACKFGHFEDKIEFVDITSSDFFRIGSLEFYPFTVPHDAVDSFAFTLESERAKAAIVTDLGYITQLVCDRVSGADVLILESNHDVEMLKVCPQYPWALKQRVLSKHGHLSNDHVAEFLERNFDGKAEHVILAHLSKNTNHPHLARLSAIQALDARGSLFFRDAERRVRIAEQDKPGPWIEL
jgi:phosphoribosyl 1,2-cyclic phosphodiesterase